MNDDNLDDLFSESAVPVIGGKVYVPEATLLNKLIYDDLLELLKSYKALLAGGAITSIFSGSKINDFDLYFENEKMLTPVKNYLDNKNNGYKKVFSSSSASTYEAGGRFFQLVHKKELLLSTPEALFNKFDFTICMGSFKFSEGEFYLHQDFLYDLARKNLNFNKNALNPVASLWRLQKYIQRGYSISSQNMLNLLVQATPIVAGIRTHHQLKELLLTVSPIAYKDIIAYMQGLRDTEIRSTEQLLEILNALPVIDNPRGGY
jgi:hypothetical protein